MYGKEIKAMRLKYKYTQSEVAKATNIPQNTISWIESDKGIPNMYRYWHHSLWYWQVLLSPG